MILSFYTVEGMEECQLLVLTRRVGEGVAIGDDIKVIVMQVKGKQVRLGIKANNDTTVHREEVYARIQEENKRASLNSSDSIELLQPLIQNSPFARAPIVLKSGRKKSS